VSDVGFCLVQRIGPLKSGRTQSFLTGFTVRGDALKGCSEGSWRSGRRRSGDVGGGGTVNVAASFRTCRWFLEHLLCHELELVDVSSRFEAICSRGIRLLESLRGMTSRLSRPM